MSSKALLLLVSAAAIGAAAAALWALTVRRRAPSACDTRAYRPLTQLYDDVKSAFETNATDVQQINASQFAGNSVLVAARIKNAYLWMEKRGAASAQLVAALTKAAAGQLEFRSWGDDLIVARPGEAVELEQILASPYGYKKQYSVVLGEQLGYLQPGEEMTPGNKGLLWIIYDKGPRILFDEAVKGEVAINDYIVAGRLASMVTALAPHPVRLAVVKSAPELREALRIYASY